MPKISAVLILRDAEATIADCLESIRAKVKQLGEIICVIDSRTSDATKEICLHYTDKVYDYEWKKQNFADARNFGASKATKDFIFNIDADETVINFGEVTNEHDYYNVEILIHKMKFEAMKVFKNNKGIHYSNAIHETIDQSINNLIAQGVSLTFGGLIGSYKHKDWNYTDEEAKEKTQAYLKGHFEQLVNEPYNDSLHYYIHASYHKLKEYNTAIHYGFLALSDTIKDPFKALVCRNLYECYKMIGEDYIAKLYLYKSIGYCKDQIFSRALLMDELKNDGAFELAKKEEDKIRQIALTGSKLPLDISIEHVVFN